MAVINQSKGKHVFPLVMIGLALFGITAIAAASASNSGTIYTSVGQDLFKKSVTIQRGKKVVAEVKLVKANQNQLSALGNSLGGEQGLSQAGAVAQTTFIFQTADQNN